VRVSSDEAFSECGLDRGQLRQPKAHDFRIHVRGATTSVAGTSVTGRPRQAAKRRQGWRCEVTVEKSVPAALASSTAVMNKPVLVVRRAQAGSVLCRNPL